MNPSTAQARVVVDELSAVESVTWCCSPDPAMPCWRLPWLTPTGPAVVAAARPHRRAHRRLSGNRTFALGSGRPVPIAMTSGTDGHNQRPAPARAPKHALPAHILATAHANGHPFKGVNNFMAQTPCMKSARWEVASLPHVAGDLVDHLAHQIEAGWVNHLVMRSSTASPAPCATRTNCAVSAMRKPYSTASRCSSVGTEQLAQRSDRGGHIHHLVE